ncbi:MAG: c-type cytochrome [Rhodanobacter sp.]
MQLRNAVFLGLLLAGGGSAAYAADPPHGDADAGAQKAFACAACHGFDGNSTTPEFPSLAGQDAEYIAAQLQAFKDGQRANQIMLGMAAALSPQDMRDVAAHFASQKFAPTTTSATPSPAGAKLFQDGAPARDVPACATCHGVDGHGIVGTAPRLAGQQSQYLRNVLGAWQAGTSWGTSAQAQIMQPIASKLSADDVSALADYITQMP